MSDSFFEFGTLQGIWGKVLREREALDRRVDTDTIFNFFVTAYHVVDYVKALATVPKTTIDELYSDPDFELCRFICNKGKHVNLRDDPGHTAHSDVSAPQSRYAVIVEGKRVDVLLLADSVMRLWRRFFQENGIRVDIETGDHASG